MTAFAFRSMARFAFPHARRPAFAEFLAGVIDLVTLR